MRIGVTWAVILAGAVSWACAEEPACFADAQLSLFDNQVSDLLGFSLTVSCTPGGVVRVPGQGPFSYLHAQAVEIRAELTDPTLFSFAGWTGTAVDAGKVVDPCGASTTVTVDGNYGLRAHFVSRLSTLVVGDNAPADPCAGDPGVSDPLENGTPDHPFDSIQKAIEVAAHGTCILVRPGLYREALDLLGKPVRVTGIDPNAPLASYPILDGCSALGPIVQFNSGEGRDCVLEGFIITRGRSGLAGAIACSHSSPTLAHCLIVGNRATGPQGAAIVCEDSAAAFLCCTIADNQGGEGGGGLSLVNSPVVLTESIVWGNGPKEILVQSATGPVVTYCDVAGTWPGVGNLAAGPWFARKGQWVGPGDPNQVLGPFDLSAVWADGDYHLQSQGGRWDPRHGAWVQDLVTSPCIDAGDPLSAVGHEPAPNGGRINLGAYGGSAQASKSSADEGPVFFADPLLKSAVEKTLGVLDPTPTDMLGLTSLYADGLYARGSGIGDLTGLQFAQNLKTFSVCNNQISDLSPLAGLANLEFLNLHENFISDLSPLAGLMHLRYLDLHHNDLRDLSPLAGLMALRNLYLRENGISDLSPLAGLTHLQELTLNDDHVGDLSALAGLADLRSLDLFDNEVSDLSPLLGLRALASLDVRADTLNDEAYCSDLQAIYQNNPGISLLYTPNPAAPQRVSASDDADSDRIAVTWNAVCNGPLYTPYYRVYRAASASGVQTPVSPWLTDLRFDDLTAVPGTAYTYWVQASTSSQGVDAGDFSLPVTGRR